MLKIKQKKYDLAAVQQCNWVLKYVINQTYEICLAAVKQNIHELQNVKNKKMLKNIIKELKNN